MPDTLVVHGGDNLAPSWTGCKSLSRRDSVLAHNIHEAKVAHLAVGVNPLLLRVERDAFSGLFRSADPDVAECLVHGDHLVAVQVRTRRSIFVHGLMYSCK